MKRLCMVLFAASGLRAATQPANSARGAELFNTLGCLQCHSIHGEGGKVGPDLGRSIDRGFTPASLAATMWNHAPGMWAAMRAEDVRPGDLDDQAAADLFAYFYSVRFFEKPGDAARATGDASRAQAPRPVRSTARLVGRLAESGGSIRPVYRLAPSEPKAMTSRS